MIAVIAATLMATSITAFAPRSECSSRRRRQHSLLSPWMASQDNYEATELTRRTWMIQVSVVGATILSTSSSPANALVYVDPDRYGDKELQVGLVNKVRQTVRDAILQDVKLAPLFLQVAIQDALTYTAQTQAGGPNGQIVGYLLENHKESPLYYAAQQLQAMRVKLRQSTEITMADVVTFAGAEAIESLGGPRIVVQLGKLDYSQEQVPMTLYNLKNGPETIGAFHKAGLTEREVTLLFGALGSMNKVVDNVLGDGTPDAVGDDEDDEPNEMGDPKVDFPTSFGAPSQIYGKRLGKMDDSIFKDEATLRKNKKATGVWTDDVVGEWTTRYAKGGFFKELPEAYSRLVRVGSTGRWEG